MCLLTFYDRAKTTTAVLATLDAKINAIASETAAAKLRQEDQEKVIQANLKEVFEKQKEKGLSAMMGRRGAHMNIPDKDTMHMDVDEPPEVKGKNRK